MPQPISQKQRAEWENRIRQQKSSGKSVSEWCLENKIHPRVFYYWRSKFSPKAIDRSCFTELTNSKSSSIVIECQGIRICLDTHFDSTALKHCLAMLRGIKC